MLPIELERTRIEALFETLANVLPFRHAQWLVEDPQTRDYRVAVARFPEGASCYDVAHRTGVIGQVFRLRRPLLVEAARAHPLYDPYDPAVDWELTVPLFLGAEMTAVLNLEGGGQPDLTQERWKALRAQVTATTGRKTPPQRPKVGDNWRFDTEWLESRELKGGPKKALSHARTVAQKKVWTLVTVKRTTEKRSLAECIRGDSAFLDLFQPKRSSPSAGEHEELKELVEGRYQMVILP